MNTLRDRHVLVTGAYRGIGAACAMAFAEAGARVACADIRNPDDTLAALRPRANGAGHSAVVWRTAQATARSSATSRTSGRLTCCSTTFAGASEHSTCWSTVPA